MVARDDHISAGSFDGLEEASNKLVEQADGEVGVQLFEEPVGAEAAFDNLIGKPTEKPYRATFIRLDRGPDGTVTLCTAKSKDLPYIEPVENRPDGFEIGKGPVKFDQP